MKGACDHMGTVLGGQKGSAFSLPLSIDYFVKDSSSYCLKMSRVASSRTWLGWRSWSMANFLNDLRTSFLLTVETVFLIIRQDYRFFARLTRENYGGQQ
jgi:hypothetical protein